MPERYLWIGALAFGVALVGCGDDEESTTCTSNCGAGASGGTGNGASGGAGNTGGGTGGDAGSGGDAGGDGGAGEGGEGGSGGGSSLWSPPRCSNIDGTPAVTFTTDEGASLTPSTGTLSGVGYTFGLVALDTPNHLLAEHKGDLLFSDDAGCNWSSIGTLQGGPLTLTAAPGGRAYAWSDNGSTFYRIENGVATLLPTPIEQIVGVGVDPTNGLHVRIGSAYGAQSDSVDGGATWVKHGSPGAIGDFVLGYRFAYDPANIDHVLFGQATEGAQMSTDGGVTWTQSAGLGKGINAFALAVSPVDGQIVWAEAFHNGPDVRHVYRSDDGGASFVPVVDETPQVDLINGNLLAPHASDPDILYFVYGSNFQNYGTDIYRYDHDEGSVTKTHNSHHDVSSIVASPADPSILYLGLTVEQI